MTLPTPLLNIQKQLFQQIPKTVFQIPVGESGYSSHLDYHIQIKPTFQRVEIVVDGIAIASSSRALLLQEDFHLPVFYLPQADVRMDLMQKTSHTTYCPFKGYAAYWTLKLGEKTLENVIWSYENPLEEVVAIQDYVSFDLSQPGIWYLEGETLYETWLKPQRLNYTNSKKLAYN